MKIFWSWQSDTHGKTGRHFVRSALSAAVDRLNQPEEIDEPLRRDPADEVQLDHDRKNVPGSPDLAPTIFKKISESQVLIADVTPVAIIGKSPTADDRRTEKGVMNPNVAIELGYALKAISSENVLMVLNTYYGDRNSLPFDLSLKAGPFMYHLAPDADAATMRAASSKLTADFCNGLRPYLQQQAAIHARPRVAQTETGTNKAVYFEDGQELATDFRGGGAIKARYSSLDRMIYLRVIPDFATAYEHTTAEILEKANSSGLSAFGTNFAGRASANKSGVISCAFRETPGEINASTQVFKSGEIWGCTTGFIREQGKFVAVLAMESALSLSLRKFVRFLEELRIEPPYRLICGIVGVDGYIMRHDDFPDTWFGPIHDNDLEVTARLVKTAPTDIDAALKDIFSKLFKLSGKPRPSVFPWPGDFQR